MRGRPVIAAVTTQPATTGSVARRFGFVSAVGVVVLSASYFVPLVMGFLTLPSPDVAFVEPWFSMMELLILPLAPLMVALTVAIHATTPTALRPFSIAAIVFMGVMAGITSSVHFVVLTLSHRDDFASLPWLGSLITFQWPSVTYSLDILAWDVFFALSVLALAPVFGGSRLTNAIRALLILSGVLAVAGLAGVVLDDMAVRNIGIVGYAVVYPVAAVLIARYFGAKRWDVAEPARGADAQLKDS
jgi:hypothetical protein